MKQVTQKLIINYGTYQPGEFLPVWSGGELINANDFIVYKLKRAAKRLLPGSLR